jgi:hypothetical protein
MIEFHSVKLVDVGPLSWAVWIMARGLDSPVFSSPGLLPFEAADELASSVAILMNLPKEVMKRG